MSGRWVQDGVGLRWEPDINLAVNDRKWQIGSGLLINEHQAPSMEPLPTTPEQDRFHEAQHAAARAESNRRMAALEAQLTKLVAPMVARGWTKYEAVDALTQEGWHIVQDADGMQTLTPPVKPVHASQSAVHKAQPTEKNASHES